MEKTPENTKSSTGGASIEGVSFEQAIKELETIVRKLEGGSGDLEASIRDYVRGTELKEFCQTKLKDARLKVESILKTQDGAAQLQPFDAK